MINPSPRGDSPAGPVPPRHMIAAHADLDEHGALVAVADLDLLAGRREAVAPLVHRSSSGAHRVPATVAGTAFVSDVTSLIHTPPLPVISDLPRRPKRQLRARAMIPARALTLR